MICAVGPNKILVDKANMILTQLGSEWVYIEELITLPMSHILAQVDCLIVVIEEKDDLHHLDSFDTEVLERFIVAGKTVLYAQEGCEVFAEVNGGCQLTFPSLFKTFSLMSI